MPRKKRNPEYLKRVNFDRKVIHLEKWKEMEKNPELKALREFHKEEAAKKKKRITKVNAILRMRGIKDEYKG